MMTYELALEMVKRAFQEEDIYHLAVAYTGKYDTETLILLVAEDYQKFNSLHFSGLKTGVIWTVGQFLTAVLVGSPNMKDADAFENEEKATQRGFYWMDSIGKWLKLSF